MSAKVAKRQEFIFSKVGKWHFYYDLEEHRKESISLSNEMHGQDMLFFYT